MFNKVIFTLPPLSSSFTRLDYRGNVNIGMNFDRKATENKKYDMIR